MCKRRTSVYVRKWLEDKFGTDLVNRGGLKVYTTLDLDLQNYAQQTISDQVKKLTEEGHNANNGAAVMIRPATGEILAMVGSADYWNDAIDGKFNVTTGSRQPGSSFKPFTHLTLLTQGVSPPQTSSTCAPSLRSPALIRPSTCRKTTIASITVISACVWLWRNR
jgi:membrane peptidoglycan carboxypeptidase